MMPFSLPTDKAIIPGLLSHPLIVSIGWLSASQLISKVIRVGSTVVVARALSPEEYGLLAIIFTVHDIVCSIIKRTSQTQLINAAEDKLAASLRQANTINWLVCTAAMLIQIVLAWLVCQLYVEDSLLLPLIFLSSMHLLMPLGMLHASMNLRLNNMPLVAKIDVLQTIVEVAVVVTCLQFHFGIWSLAIAKWLTMPVWLIAHRKTAPRHSYSRVGWVSSRFIKKSLLVVTTDLVVVLKQNIDYLIVGYALGVEVLGLYFFAFNAGLGIATTFIQAAGSAFLPYVRSRTLDNHELTGAGWFGMRLAVGVSFVIVMLQVFAAPVYVPLVFGEKWIDAGALPLLILLCFSAIPRAALEMCCQIVRARHQYQYELRINVLTLMAMTGVIVIAVSFGAKGVAIGVGIAYLLSLALSVSVMRQSSRLEQLPLSHVVHKKTGKPSYDQA